MRNAITVMNAKGGVGKSTLTLTMAETLSVHHSKKVLVVDSDAHASISTMLISPDSFETIQGQGGTGRKGQRGRGSLSHRSTSRVGVVNNPESLAGASLCQPSP